MDLRHAVDSFSAGTKAEASLHDATSCMILSVYEHTVVGRSHLARLREGQSVLDAAVKFWSGM